MLSVAQAVHHPEAPASAPKHSVRPWSSERPNMLKRRKTEPDCCAVDKKSSKNSIENLTKSLNFNNPEITLTLIHKNNNNNNNNSSSNNNNLHCRRRQNNQNEFKELLQGKIKTSPIVSKEVELEEEEREEREGQEQRESIEGDAAQEDKKDSDRIPTNIPPVVIFFLENSEEIQLTKLGSNENIKFINQNEMHNSPLAEEREHNLSESIEEVADTSKQKNTFLDSNSIELSEVTIEPYVSYNKAILTQPPSSPVNNSIKDRKIIKTQTRLERARELLKNKEQTTYRSLASSSDNETVKTNSTEATNESQEQAFAFEVRNEFSEEVNEPTFASPRRLKQSCIFDEESEHHAPVSSISDFESFNFGISCDHFYSNIKDKPYYTTGFPNPPGENRCWTNATLQALFTLPIINKLDTLEIPECSKLITSLASIQTFWHKGSTDSHSFEQVFSTFKEELSELDKLYSSKAQQDVSEFVMNLLNFIKTEFENVLLKEIHSNEIENIPNNEQDSLPRLQCNTYDANKRAPLADISAFTGQHRNSGLATFNGHQESSSLKTNSSPAKLKQGNQTEVTSNPIDEYFSLFMTENYICDNCSKQRQQKVENLILFIDLPSDDHGTTVDLVDLINTTYALEHRYMTCESCKHDAHSMITKLKKLPKILIVQVKRYEMTKDGIISKKSTMVEIPKLLKLNSLVIYNSQDFSHSPEYEPICIISHIGDNIDSGHYISFVKHEENWFYYDDMNVKLLSDDEVFKCIQSNAYVIFFQDTRLGESTDITIDQKNKKESIAC